MLKLPSETEVNSRIQNETIFMRAIRKSGYRALYTDQVNELWWRNKLSEQNFGFDQIGVFKEIEVFETKLSDRTLDKRLLRETDRAIPYYILHVLSFSDRYQVLVADKHMKGSNVRVENYIRSCWLSSDELSFDFGEKSIDRLYESLERQVVAKSRKSLGSVPEEESDAFMRYFRKMAMTRSYKPVLIIATLRSGGQISINKAADFFRKYYSDRIKNELPVEKGKCVYSDLDTTQKDIENNLIKNPVAALCGSGFFTYDQNARVFSFAPGIYDGLTVDEIDAVIQICRERLTDYFRGR